MKTFLVELTGVTPLLHHRMTEEEMVKILHKTKEKKNVVKAYDETPRQIAEKHAYKSKDGDYYIPSGYIKGAFSHVASDYKQTTGKKSLKSIAGGVFVPTSDTAIMLDKNNNPVKTFEVQIDKGNNRNAGSGTAVIICRPRFDDWKVRFYVEIDTDLLSESQAQTILEDAGRRAGIGSWRVSKGGVYGKFNVTLFQELSGVEKDKFYNLNKLKV